MDSKRRAGAEQGPPSVAASRALASASRPWPAAAQDLEPDPADPGAGPNLGSSCPRSLTRPP
jgi:hypothetical protein